MITSPNHTSDEKENIQPITSASCTIPIDPLIQSPSRSHDGNISRDLTKLHDTTIPYSTYSKVLEELITPPKFQQNRYFSDLPYSKMKSLLKDKNLNTTFPVIDRVKEIEPQSLCRGFSWPSVPLDWDISKQWLKKLSKILFSLHYHHIYTHQTHELENSLLEQQSFVKIF